MKKPCPKCDPGIEIFYQKKVKEAKLSVEYLDSKDIWCEYCQLKKEQAADDLAEEDYNREMFLGGLAEE